MFIPVHENSTVTQCLLPLLEQLPQLMSPAIHLKPFTTNSVSSKAWDDQSSLQYEFQLGIFMFIYFNTLFRQNIPRAMS